MQGTIRKPESYRKRTKKGWTGGHSNQQCAESNSSTTREKLMETDAHLKMHKSQASKKHIQMEHPVTRT